MNEIHNTDAILNLELFIYIISVIFGIVFFKIYAELEKPYRSSTTASIIRKNEIELPARAHMLEIERRLAKNGAPYVQMGVRSTFRAPWY